MREMAISNPNSASTQRSITLNSYRKVGEWLSSTLQPDSILDFGAGLGEGTRALQQTNPEAEVFSYEPFPQGWDPDFRRSEDIPSSTFQAIVSLNVLNVLPRNIRDEVVVEIWDSLSPGGTAVIGVRGWSGDVGSTKNFEPSDEEKSLLVKTKVKGKEELVFQKGFDKAEFLSYLQELLPEASIEFSKNAFAKVCCILNKR